MTTTHAGKAGRPADLVDRQFVATRPNQLWVADFTYVARRTSCWMPWSNLYITAMPGRWDVSQPSVGSQGDAYDKRRVGDRPVTEVIRGWEYAAAAGTDRGHCGRGWEYLGAPIYRTLLGVLKEEPDCVLG